MRTKKFTEEQIIIATILCIAENGLENFTTKKIAVEMGISEGTIYNNYSTKTDLVVACFYWVDKQIDNTLKEVPFSLIKVPAFLREMWGTYFNYLVTHPNETIFYQQFLHSSYCTPEVIEGQDQSFRFFSNIFNKFMSTFAIDVNLFWTFLLETTITFAISFAKGTIPMTEENVESVFQLLVHGINGTYHPEELKKTKQSS